MADAPDSTADNSAAENPTNSTPSPPPNLDVIVECDPLAPLPTANAFRQQPIPLLPTDGATMRKNDLCDGRWQWYHVQPKLVRTIPRDVRVVEADGVTRTVTRTTAAEGPCAR